MRLAQCRVQSSVLTTLRQMCAHSDADMTRILILFPLLLVVVCRAQLLQRQQPFLTEIFPEQFEQQQLQFLQNQLQVQLQQVQQALEARPQDPGLRDSLLRQQEQFLSTSRDIEQQHLVLQQRIQERLNGVQMPIQAIQVQQRRPAGEQQDIPQEPLRKSPPSSTVEGPCKTVAGESGTCRPLVSCLSFYAELPELKKQPCKLAANEFGVCCPTKITNPGGYLSMLFIQ